MFGMAGNNSFLPARAAPFFSLSSAKGGEGRGEEADSSSNPLAPTLSPLGRGEGVGPYQDAPIFCLHALLVLEGQHTLVCGSIA
jgi:hypothetical protein